MNRLAIIVLNWNGADDAIGCMESLLQQTTPLDIVLVDNNSQQDSINELEAFVKQKETNHIIFLKNTVNSGYSGGNNFGFTYALKQGYDYIGTLNPDAVADKNWAKNLVADLGKKSDVGIAGGILARSDKKHIDSTGDFYPTWGIPGPRGRDSLLENAPKQPEYVFGITGGGFIAKATMFRDIGLFDEKFFMYYEDVDLCFRAQLAGYRVHYTPSAIAYHKLSASTDTVPGLAVTQTFKNLPMLFIKNVPLALWPTILPRFTLAYFLIFANSFTHQRGVSALKGWLKSILLLSHAFHQRRNIQSSKRVDNQYVSSIILHDIPPEQTGLRKFRSMFTGKKSDSPVIYPIKRD